MAAGEAGAVYRLEAKLVPVHSEWIKLGQTAGFDLHDLAVRPMIRSTQLRMWRRAYTAKRTSKAHEYVVVFRKPE